MPWGECTRKDEKSRSTYYLCVFDWPEDGVLEFGNDSRVRSVTMLHNNESLSFSKTKSGISIMLPSKAPNDTASVIKVELNTKLKPIKLISNSDKYFEIIDNE